MSNYSPELSNLSYTNKDFNQIYTELLDLTKKISYKWDPSLSDESDPGVVLLKIAALMADKCNYNIDKNVLELFPMSVTQLANARQLYDQCGYTMRYFRSATTNIVFKLTSEPELSESDIAEMRPELTSENGVDIEDIKLDVNGYYLRHYKIPKFTMLSDVDNTVVYTLLEDVHVPSNGNAVSAEAMQGTVRTFTLNGSDIITADMIDSRNRIYLTEINIPENGIFITNKNEEEYWKQCDNLTIQPLNTKCYKFGLALDGTRCYIEFPSDAKTLIGSGLNIRYLLTAGSEGNVKKRVITNFFAESEITRTIGSMGYPQVVSLTTDNMYMYNDAASLDGRNPESIEDAYKNYQKVKTTFETLVSTTDYSNFLVTNNDLSNCVVCDRSSDIQSSYSILTDIDGEAQLIPHVREKEVSYSAKDASGNSVNYKKMEPEMTAFDLRIYGLKYVDGFNDYNSFTKSFEIVDSSGYSSIEPSTSDVKCLSHNYLSFKPDEIILLKNRYPIVAKIVSPYKLGLSQQEEILNIVRLKLFNILNSQKVDFGQEIDYNLVYETILTADPRISAVVLEDIRYETYAAYLSSYTEKIEHIRIDSKSEAPFSDSDRESEFLTNLWKKFRVRVYTSSVLNGKTPLFIPDGVFVYSLAHEHAKNGSDTYDVNEMSTYVNIPLIWDGSENLHSRVLNPNEVITVTAPNLVLDKRYANYCKFVTNIGRGLNRSILRSSAESTEDPVVVVKKDSEYALEPDEYIVFFWRTTDSDTEDYTYVKYTGRNKDSEEPFVICPSFDIVRQPQPEKIGTESVEIDDKFFFELGDTLSAISDGKQLTIKNYMYADRSLNSVVYKYFIGERFNLKSNSVEVKRVNKIHLNNSSTGTNKFYWILNDVIDGKYRLFSSDPGDTERTLEDGEMLIYSNNRLTQLYVLGAGTKISRALSCSKGVKWGAWELPALEHKMEFLSSVDGPAYFENPEHRWFNIKNNAAGFDLYATEMLYRKLGSQTQLIVTPPSESKNVEDKYIINSEGKVLYENGKQASDFHMWRCSLTIKNEFGEEEKLPDRNAEAISWKVSPSLNLNMSYDSPQRVYGGQTISWPCKGDIVSVAGSDISEIYIQSDRPIVYSGGGNIDVRSYDVLTGNYSPLRIYIYKTKEVDMSVDIPTNHYDAVWEFSNNEITVEGQDVSITNIALPAGNYILPISVSNLKNTYSHIDAGWKELRSIKLSKLTDKEKNLMGEIHTTGATNDPSNQVVSDWQVARKPVNLSDVASWIYGEAYVNVTDEFGLNTVTSVFNSLFEQETIIGQESETSSTEIFYKKKTAVEEAYEDLNRMCVDYGGKLIKEKHPDPITNYEVGDIVCCRVDSDIVGVRGSEVYLLWIYAPTQVEGQSPFIWISSDGICDRKSQEMLDEILHDDGLKYFYTLRPSNVTDIVSSEEDSATQKLETVTKVIVDSNATYYYMLSVPSVPDGCPRSTYTLQLKYDEDSGDDIPRYTIHTPLKYVAPKLTDDAKTNLNDDILSDGTSFFDAILAQISVEDSRGLFKYDYEVPESELVAYPLDASAFLYADHPMNRFTICQYVIEDGNSSDIIVSGKLR